MKFLILSEWKFMDQIPCWQCISLILNSGECFVGDLEPIEYLAAYDQNDRLNYDWELSLVAGIHPTTVSFIVQIADSVIHDVDRACISVLSQVIRVE